MRQLRKGKHQECIIHQAEHLSKFSEAPCSNPEIIDSDPKGQK